MPWLWKHQQWYWADSGYLHGGEMGREEDRQGDQGRRAEGEGERERGGCWKDVNACGKLKILVYTVPQAGSPSLERAQQRIMLIKPVWRQHEGILLRAGLTASYGYKQVGRPQIFDILTIHRHATWLGSLDKREATSKLSTRPFIDSFIPSWRLWSLNIK